MKILLDAFPDPEAEILARSLGHRLPLRPARFSAPLEEADIYWIHRGPDGPGEPPSAAVLDDLRSRVGRGARVLLTGPAAALVGDLGVVDVPPRLVPPLDGRDRGADVLGVVPFGEHPLFRRWPGGVLLSGCHADAPGMQAVHEPPWPTDAAGAVTGVARGAHQLFPELGVLSEHRVGKGRVLALGVRLCFAQSDDGFAEHRLRFCGDLADYLMNDGRAAQARPWPSVARAGGAAPVELFGNLPDTIAAPAFPGLEPLAAAPAAPHAAAGGEAVFDLLADRASFAVGGGGPRAPWLHAAWKGGVRFVRDVRVAWCGVDGAAVDSVAQRLVRGDRHVERSVRVGEVAVREVVRLDPDGRGLLLEWHRAAADAPVADLTLALEIVGGLDLAPPMPAGLLAPLFVHGDSAGRDAVWREGVLGHVASLHAERTPITANIEVVPGQVAFAWRARFALDSAQPVRVLLCAAADLATLRRDLAAVQHAEFHGRVAVAAAATPAAGTSAGGDGAGGEAAAGPLVLRFRPHELDEEAWWCVRGAADFGVDAGAEPPALPGRGAFTPTAIGPGVVPAFSARDFLTFGRALLAAGHRRQVRDTLLRIAELADPEGRVADEITLGGLPFFSGWEPAAAFVYLTERYLAFTGDLATTRRLWAVARRSLAWINRLDRDGDGLPDETGVVRDPRGSDRLVRVDQATLLAKALASGARLAQELDERNLASECGARAARVTQILEHTFFDAGLARYAHAVRAEGCLEVGRSVRSVLPVALGLCPDPSAARVMSAFARATFTTDWGVRGLASDDPGYDPAREDAGAVSCAWTGITALADCVAGRPEAAFARLGALLHQTREFGAGVIGALLRGDRFAPADGRAHTLAGHGAALSALVEGILGVSVGEREPALVLAPTLPGSIDHAAFERLGILDHVLSGDIARGPTGAGLVVRLRKQDERPLPVILAPFFPSPCRVDGVHGPDGPIAHELHELGEGIRVRVAFVLGERCELNFAVAPDLLLAPHRARPFAGARSEQAQVVARSVEHDGNAVRIDLEARPGWHALPVRLAGRAPIVIEGGTLEHGALRFEVRGGAPDAWQPVVLRLGFAPGERRDDAQVSAGEAAAASPAAGEDEPRAPVESAGPDGPSAAAPPMTERAIARDARPTIVVASGTGSSGQAAAPAVVPSPVDVKPAEDVVVGDTDPMRVIAAATATPALLMPPVRPAPTAGPRLEHAVPVGEAIVAATTAEVPAPAEPPPAIPVAAVPAAVIPAEVRPAWPMAAPPATAIPRPRSGVRPALAAGLPARPRARVAPPGRGTAPAAVPRPPSRRDAGERTGLIVTLVLVAAVMGGGVWYLFIAPLTAIDARLPVMARERGAEEAAGVAPLAPLVTPPVTPPVTPAAGAAFEPMGASLVGLDLATVVSLLGPPCTGEPPYDSGYEFALAGVGRLRVAVDAGGRVTTATAVR